jgi:hypothetical protein
MAKKKWPNKSELIRKQMKENPEHMPADIYAALKPHDVSMALISNVRSKLKAKKASKKKAGRPKAAATHHASNGHSHVAFLHSALGLGLDKAIDLLQKVKAAVE